MAQQPAGTNSGLPFHNKPNILESHDFNDLVYDHMDTRPNVDILSCQSPFES